MIPPYSDSITHLAPTVFAATSKSSSSSSTLILFVLLFAAMYFLWLRPQRKKLQQRQQAQIRAIEIGDEVVTQSGIVGTVVALDEDRAQVQVSTGVTITVVRAAIGRRIEPVAPEVHEAEEEHDMGFNTPDYQQSVDDEPPKKNRFWPRRNTGDDV